MNSKRDLAFGLWCLSSLALHLPFLLFSPTAGSVVGTQSSRYLVLYFVLMALSLLFIVFLGPLALVNVRSHPYVASHRQRLSGSRLATGRLMLLSLVFFCCGLMHAFSDGPWFDDDIYRYLSEGSAMSVGVSPYETPPSMYSDLTRANGLLRDEDGERDYGLELIVQSHLKKVGYPEVPSVYPPLTLLLFQVHFQLSNGSLEIWRLVSVFQLTFAFLFCGWIGLLESGKLNPALLLFFWTPVVSELVGASHTEVTLVFIVSLCLFLARVTQKPIPKPQLERRAFEVARKWPVSIWDHVFMLFAFSLCFALKPHSLLLFPAFLRSVGIDNHWRTNAKVAVFYGAAAGAMLALQWIVCKQTGFLEPSDWTENVNYFAKYWVFFPGPLEGLQLLLSEFSTLSAPESWSMAGTLSIPVLVGLIFGYSICQSPWRKIAVGCCLLYSFQSTVNPWYSMIVLPFIVVGPHKPRVNFSSMPVNSCRFLVQDSELRWPLLTFIALVAIASIGYSFWTFGKDISSVRQGAWLCFFAFIFLFRIDSRWRRFQKAAHSKFNP